MRADFTDEFTGTPAETACSLLTQEGMRALNAILQGDYTEMSDRTFAEVRDLVALAVEASMKVGHLDGIHGAFVDADGKVTSLKTGRSYELPHGTELRWSAPPVIAAGKPGLYALTPKAEAAIKAFVESVPLTQEAFTVGSDALEREIERSYGEPLDAVPDEIADQRAEAVRRVIGANRLLAQAVAVLGPEAVDLVMYHLAAPDLTEAA